MQIDAIVPARNEGLTVADLPRALAERTFDRIEPALVETDGELFLEYAVEGP